MALGDYLAGEVAQDFADGLVGRREALRRLTLLGLSVTGAGALLAACGGDGPERAGQSGTIDDRAPSTSTATSPTTASAAAAKDRAEPVTFPGPERPDRAGGAGPGGELQGAYASPDDPKASVLVIHENRGLTDHFYDLAGRLAADGYAALAIDLLSAQGGTAKLADPAAAPAALSAAPLDTLLGDLRAGIDELQRRYPNLKVGVVGFCYGGGMTWNLLNAGESRVAAAVPFYGPAPETPTSTGPRRPCSPSTGNATLGSTPLGSAPERPSRRPACPTRSARFPERTTPSSTTPASATTPRPLRRPTRRSCSRSTGIWRRGRLSALSRGPHHHDRLRRAEGVEVQFHAL